MMDPNFFALLAALVSIAAMLMALIVFALILGKGKEARQLVAALRDLFKKLP